MHKKLLAILLVVLLLVVIIPMPVYAETGSLVGTSDKFSATGEVNQRSVFYANGRHWVFYIDDTKYVYRTATDGSSWSATTTVLDNSDCEEGEHVSLVFDGTYIHYAHGFGAQNFALKYKRGTPNADGTITWSAIEQTAKAAEGSVIFTFPSIAIDTDGKAYITYINRTTDRVYVTKNDNTDGTWSTASGFPHLLEDITSTSGVSLNLTSGKMYFIYYASNNLKGIAFDGDSTWDAAQTIVTDCNGDKYYSATSRGDIAYAAWLTTYKRHVEFSERSEDSWSSPIDLDDGENYGFARPVIASRNDTGDLTVFWGSNPTLHHIYYINRVSGAWDGSATDWIDESSDTLSGNYGMFTCSLQTYGLVTALFYTTKSSGPYNLKYAFLQDDPPPNPTHAVYTLVGVSPYIFVGACLIGAVAVAASGSAIGAIIMVVIAMIIAITGAGIIQGMIP